MHSHHAASQAWTWRRIGLLAALIINWYLFSYLFNANLKQWFNLHASTDGQDTLFPLLFSIFVSNTAASALWVAHAGGWKGCDVLGGTCLSQLVFAHKLDFALLCASGVVGMATTVLVLEYGSIQLVQIARSVGPLFTAFWAYLVLNQATWGAPLICLAATLAGTMLASWREPSFCLMTAVLMFTVNATLTFRNTATKKLLHHFSGHSPSLLAAALLALTSGVGLLLVTVLWFGSLLLGKSAMLPRDLATHRQLFVLGACNFAYNLASQLVLASVAVVSHGMLELAKRVFVLLAASMLLQDVAWQWHNVLGAVIASAATALYFVFAAQQHHHNHQHQHQAGAAGQTGTGPAAGTHDKQQQVAAEEKDGAVGSVGGLATGAASGISKRQGAGALATDGGAIPEGGKGGPGGARGWGPGGYGPASPGRSFVEGWLGTPSARTRLANTLIITLLVLSPLEFVQGAVWSRFVPGLGGRSVAKQQKQQQALGLAAAGLGLRGPVPTAQLFGLELPEEPYVAGVAGGNAWSPYMTASLKRRGSAAHAVSCQAQGDVLKALSASDEEGGASAAGAGFPLEHGGGQAQAARAVSRSLTSSEEAGLSEAGGRMLSQAASSTERVGQSSGSAGATEAGAVAGSTGTSSGAVNNAGSTSSTGSTSSSKRAQQAVEEAHVLDLRSSKHVIAAAHDAHGAGSSARSTSSSGGGAATEAAVAQAQDLASSQASQQAVAQQSKPQEQASATAAGASQQAQEQQQVQEQRQQRQAAEKRALGQVEALAQSKLAAAAAATGTATSATTTVASGAGAATGAGSITGGSSSGGGGQIIASGSGGARQQRPQRDRGARGPRPDPTPGQLLQANLRGEALWNAGLASRLAPRAPPPSASALLGVYTGWIGRDNLGDEIVADIFFDLLVAAVLEATAEGTRVTFDRNATRLATRYEDCGARSGVACDFAVLGGGSTVYLDYVKRIAEPIRAGAPVLLFGAGRQEGLLAKRLNDHYMRLLGSADLVGGVRGRHTADYLLQVGRRRVQVIRDSAVLSGVLFAGGRTALSNSTSTQLPEPVLGGGYVSGTGAPGSKASSGSGSSTDSAKSSKTGSQKGSSATSGARPLVVITLRGVGKEGGDPSPADILSGAAGGPLAVYMHTIEQLINRHHYQVVLQAVDPESQALHAAYMPMINSRVEAGRARVTAHNEYHDWAAVADLYARAAASLNSRLHSGVLALGAARPTLYLASNIKYTDLMASIGMQAYVVDPTGFGDSPEGSREAAHKVVVPAILSAAANASAISAALQAAQQDTLALYRTSMDDLLMRLETRDPQRYHRVMCCRHIHVSRAPPVVYRQIVSVECMDDGAALDATGSSTAAATAGGAAGSLVGIGGGSSSGVRAAGSGTGGGRRVRAGTAAYGA